MASFHLLSFPEEQTSLMVFLPHTECEYWPLITPSPPLSATDDDELAIVYRPVQSSQSTAVRRFLQFSSVQLLSPVWLFATPWTAARQASLSITNSRSSLKLMSIESVMPSNHLILCRPLLLPPSIFPSIRVFSNESVLRIRWPKY